MSETFGYYYYHHHHHPYSLLHSRSVNSRNITGLIYQVLFSLRSAENVLNYYH